MPKKVYNNIEGHRLIDNGRTVEDVTKFSPPTVKHPTTTIEKVSGMAMDVDLPDQTHLEPMELSVVHNNGVNCNYMSDPGKHNMEIRTVRQRYNVALAEIEHESVKFRFVAVHVSKENNDVETGSPYGSTDKFSVLRNEEEVNGEVITIVDAAAGIIRFNGVDYTNIIESYLS